MTNEEMDQLDRWLAIEEMKWDRKHYNPESPFKDWQPTRNIAQAFEVEKRITSDEIWFQITCVHGYGYEVTVFKQGIDIRIRESGGSVRHRLPNELWTGFEKELALVLSKACKEAWEAK